VQPGRRKADRSARSRHGDDRAPPGRCPADSGGADESSHARCVSYDSGQRPAGRISLRSQAPGVPVVHDHYTAQGPQSRNQPTLPIGQTGPGNPLIALDVPGVESVHPHDLLGGPGSQVDRRTRPFARRAISILRPPRVDIRTRKPWVRARFSRLGWKVLFIYPIPRSMGALANNSLIEKGSRLYFPVAVRSMTTDILPEESPSIPSKNRRLRKNRSSTASSAVHRLWISNGIQYKITGKFRCGASSSTQPTSMVPF